MKKLLFVIALAAPLPAMATGLVAGATEFTQFANNLLLGYQYETQLEQYITQYKHLEAQLTDMKLNPSSALGSEVTTVIGKVGGMMSAGQAIGGTFARIDGNIAKKYGDETAGNYSEKFASWTKGNQDSLGAAMRAAGLHRDGYANDTAALNALYAKTQSSQGSVAAIQTLSEIAAMQVQQTQKLQDLVATQNVATSDFMATQNAKQQAAEAANAQITIPDKPISKKTGNGKY